MEGTTRPEDIIALVAIGAFVLAFAGLAFAALRKKRRERLEILTRGSEDADAEHDLGDYVDGKKLPPKQDLDLVPTPSEAASGGDLAEAELEAKRAAADQEQARRERVRLEKSGQADDDALAEAQAKEEAAAAAAAEAQVRAEKLRDALTQTREGIFGRISKALSGKAIDDSIIEELEAILFTSDIGARTAERLLDTVKKRLKAKELGNLDKVQAAIREEIATILRDKAGPAQGLDVLGAVPDGGGPRVVMIVGVNGAGKTTTIGKLTHQLRGAGKSVLLGAGDTFRAAAVEQLQVWADRNDVPIVRGKEGADPASVLFDAVEKGKADGVDVVLCDTAGRLHTKVNLMEELSKVHRVLGKAKDGAPHEVLLVLDATVGQNAIQQARQFGEAVALSGIVLTKLDGTAKGGVIIGIAEELGVPVRFIGVGEQIGDLRPFDAEQFAAALFGLVEVVDSTRGSSTKGAPVHQTAETAAEAAAN